MSMMRERGDKEIKREFRLRQSRQSLAIAVMLVLLLSFTFLYGRPDLFGVFSKKTIVGAQIVLITAFIIFSGFNWRCPSCNKYLGADIGRRICRRCGTRLR